MPEDIQSRFTVLERPTESPGKCAVCGASDRPVVDFGVDIDWADQGYGRAFFCEYCIKQAASKFPHEELDMVPREDYYRAVATAKAELTNAVHELLVNFSPISFDPGTDDRIEVEPEVERTLFIETVRDIADYSDSESGTDVEAVSDDSGEGPISISGDSGNGRPKPEPFRLDL